MTRAHHPLNERSGRLCLVLVVLLVAQIGGLHGAPAQDRTEHLLNTLKKRPRTKPMDAWLEERREAARELGRMKEKRAVPTLLQIIQKERFDVILEIAIDALGEIGDKRAVPPLKKLLNDPSLDAYVRDAVAGALRKLGEEGPKPVEPPKPVKPVKPVKPEEIEPGPESREAPPDREEKDLATRLAKLNQPFGGLPPLDLKLPADLLARAERWEIATAAADMRWDKAAGTVRGGLSLASRARVQVERRNIGYSIDGDLGIGFRVTDTANADASWDLGHSLAINPELRYYPFQRDLPLLFFQLSGGAGYGLDFSAHPTIYDRRVAFAGTLSVGGGPGYGRIYDVGPRLRLRRLQAVLKKSGLLTGPIDRVIGDQIIAAWYQLRNRVGSFWELGHTLDILHRAGLLNAKECLDPATIYRIIRVLDDPQLQNRREGMMFRLGYGYARNIIKDLDDVGLGFVYLTGEHAWQIGTTRSIESSLRFYYEMLSDPDLYGVTARSAFTQYLYNGNLDSLGALSAFLSAGMNNQPGPSFTDGGLGYQVMVGGSYSRLFNRGTEISLAAQFGIERAAPLLLITLGVRYGIAYGAISPSE